MHLIMMMVKKYTENYLQGKKTTIPPLPPAFSFSSSLSENRNKIAKKMYMNTLRSSELTQFKQDSIQCNHFQPVTHTWFIRSSDCLNKIGCSS